MRSGPTARTFVLVLTSAALTGLIDISSIDILYYFDALALQ